MTSPSMKTPLVLIVDDNRKNLKLARDVLRAAGFRTLEAERAADAIALAAEHVPDVILMDRRLPDMDGGEAARSLSRDARTAAIPVVALSAGQLDARVAPRGRVRRLPREADQHRSVPGAGARLLHAARELTEPRVCQHPLRMQASTVSRSSLTPYRPSRRARRSEPIL